MLSNRLLIFGWIAFKGRGSWCIHSDIRMRCTMSTLILLSQIVKAFMSHGVWLYLLRPEQNRIQPCIQNSSCNFITFHYTQTFGCSLGKRVTAEGRLCMFDIRIPFLIQPLEGDSFPDGIESTTFHLTSEWVEDKNIKRYVGLKWKPQNKTYYKVVKH